MDKLCDWSINTFLGAVLGMLIAAIVLVAIDSCQNDEPLRETLRIKQELADIAMEKCLVAGYPEFRSVNGNFYCVKTVDGEFLVKQMVVE